MLNDAKAQVTRYAELFNSGGTADEQAACWTAIHTLEKQAREKFPLSDAECVALRAGLADRVRAIHAAEVAAHEQLISVL